MEETFFIGGNEYVGGGNAQAEIDKITAEIKYSGGGGILPIEVTDKYIMDVLTQSGAIDGITCSVNRFVHYVDLLESLWLIYVSKMRVEQFVIPPRFDVVNGKKARVIASMCGEREQLEIYDAILLSPMQLITVIGDCIKYMRGFNVAIKFDLEVVESAIIALKPPAPFTLKKIENVKQLDELSKYLSNLELFFIECIKVFNLLSDMICEETKKYTQGAISFDN